MVDGLFGPQPLVRPRGRGRPAHAWERRISLRICNLFACGHTVEKVAAAVGLSQPTLRKVYFSEWQRREVMELMVKSEQMARLTERAIDGNVAAEKALAGMIQAERRKVEGDRFAEKPKAAPPKGVKQERREAAWTAGRDVEGWGDLLHGETGKPLAN
jgi:predicted transcriptional regulator